MGHHSVVSTAIAIVNHVTAVHQQVTRACIAAVEGLAQASHLVSAKQSADTYCAIGSGSTVVSTAVRSGL